MCKREGENTKKDIEETKVTYTLQTIKGEGVEKRERKKKDKNIRR